MRRYPAHAEPLLAAFKAWIHYFSRCIEKGIHFKAGDLDISLSNERSFDTEINLLTNTANSRGSLMASVYVNEPRQEGQSLSIAADLSIHFGDGLLLIVGYKFDENGCGWRLYGDDDLDEPSTPSQRKFARRQGFTLDKQNVRIAEAEGHDVAEHLLDEYVRLERMPHYRTYPQRREMRV